MDLKYRETLPSTIRDVLLSMSDDDSRKKRKSRKRKLGKNGLYPEEEGFIRKWWRDRALADNGVPAESSRDAELKKHIADLRLRETQLQILLILETLALEMSGPGERSKRDDPEKPSDDTKTKSKKKPQDLDVLLELHLDRLCIWHAVSTDDTSLAESAKSFDSQSGKKIESDAVRDFCTEVIIPFYASRLPDRCKLITRKLGVSGAISPLAKQSSSTKKTSRTEPGKPAERQSSQRNPRRSLQRVLTDQQTASQGRPPSRPPSLGRSNTVPSQLEVNRESIEPLLPVLSVSARGGIQKPKRAENREVDLNAVARQHEAKLKKVQMLMEQKKELDAAINALRKPNRELVAKDIAEDAVKRTSGGSSRKPKNPVRNPFGQGVQVMATPKGNRQKDAVTGLPPPFKNIVRSSASKIVSSPFASEPQVVPASTLRPSFSNTSTSGGRVGDMGAIQETPSRRPAQSLDASPSVAKNLFRVPRRPIPRSTDVAPSTPIAPRSDDHVIGIKSSMVMETPPRPVPIVQESMFAPLASPAAVLTTPVKSSARLAVPVFSAVPVTPEKSIYEQLGWDDDLA
jgi:DNA replication regulator SLD3